MAVRSAALGSSAVGAVSRFAAAFGFGTAASAEDRKEEDDDDEGEGEKGKKGKKAKPARLEGESDEDYAKRCEDDEKKAEGEDDEKNKAEKDEEEKKEAAAKNRAVGAKAERDRWTAVLSSKEANGKGLAACELLSNEAMAGMSAQQVCGILATMPASKATGIYARMAERDETERATASPGGGEGPAPGGAKAKASAMIAAADKFRGEPKK